MRNCYGRRERSEKALCISEKVLTGAKGVRCGWKTKWGRLYYERHNGDGQENSAYEQKNQGASFITHSVLTVGEMLMEGSLQFGSGFIGGYTMVETADSFL